MTRGQMTRDEMTGDEITRDEMTGDEITRSLYVVLRDHNSTWSCHVWKAVLKLCQYKNFTEFTELERRET
jgi:hypothetical protein